jgi:hypothetical protein
MKINAIGSVERWKKSAVSSIEHRTSNAERRTSNAERRTPNAERRTSNVQRRIKERFADVCALHRHEHSKHSNVIPSEVEGPHKCGERNASRRGPSTSLRMTLPRVHTTERQIQRCGLKLGLTSVKTNAIGHSSSACPPAGGFRPNFLYAFAVATRPWGVLRM